VADHGRRPCKHCTQGIGIWEWASSDQGQEPDVVMACCGDTPTLETLAAVTILRELPELKIRVINVVDLMRLQPDTQHPHGLTDEDYDMLFTKDKPIIFAFHGYPTLIHKLTYRRHNRTSMCAATKRRAPSPRPSTCASSTSIDRFHLVMLTPPAPAAAGQPRRLSLNQQMKDKLVEHKQYIREYGVDLPEVRNWKWETESK
jgi:xylulose-5-phosphate/fructose-6-phosphate phosphoketolase